VYAGAIFICVDHGRQKIAHQFALILYPNKEGKVYAGNPHYRPQKIGFLAAFDNQTPCHENGTLKGTPMDQTALFGLGSCVNLRRPVRPVLASAKPEKMTETTPSQISRTYKGVTAELNAHSNN
jgi:hypothetical protein